MESKSKIQYRSFCDENPSVAVFSQPWYLDACTNMKWDATIAINKDGVINGVLPYALKKKLGIFTSIIVPLYCPFLGPNIVNDNRVKSAYKKNSNQFSIVGSLIEQLPKVDYCNIQLNPDGNSWFPFFQKGYKQTTRYTYVIDHKQGLKNIAANLKSQLRNTLLKPANENLVEVSQELDLFIDLLKANFQDKNIQGLFDKDKIKRIINGALENDAGKLYVITKPGHLIAAAFILNDQLKSYTLFTASSTEGKSSEAVAIVLWKAIQDAVEAGRDFDFEGSMLPGVEKFFRSFGGQQVPYHRISKINNPLLRLYFRLFKNA